MSNDDDAWLAQLREAMASGGASPPTARGDAGPARSNGAQSNGARPHGADDRTTAPEPAAGLGSVRDAVRFLGVRMTTVESLVEDIARAVRRTGDRPTTAELEDVVTRVLRAELPAVVDQHLASLPPATPDGPGDESPARWAERAEDGEVPSADLALLAHELRSRIGELEEMQRRAFQQLAADRKALIDDAVREIRTLLFG